jgi:hypothetical protein
MILPPLVFPDATIKQQATYWCINSVLCVLIDLC